MQLMIKYESYSIHKKTAPLINTFKTLFLASRAIIKPNKSKTKKYPTKN